MKLFSAIVNEDYKVWKNEKIAFSPEFNFENTQINSAINDIACAQLLLHSNESYTISLTDDPAFYEGGFENIYRIHCYGHSVNKQDISLYKVGLMEDDDRNFRADPLWTNSYYHAEKNQTHSVFIKINVNENFAPGCHDIFIDIYESIGFEDEKLYDRLKFSLKVYDVFLPPPQDWKFYLDLWQHNSNIARKHEVKLWSDEHFEVIDSYVKSLYELGQKAITVIVSQIPWCGQLSFSMSENPADLHEYSCIEIIKEFNGNWRYDFSNLDKLLSIYFKNKIDSEIEVIGLLGVWVFEEFGYKVLIDDYNDGIRLRYYDEKSNTYKYIRNLDGLIHYVKALESFFIDRDLINKVRIVADEPSDIAKFRNNLAFLRKIAPSFKYKAAINHIEFLEENIDGLLDYVPVMPLASSKSIELKNFKLKNPDSRICTYVCCWPDYPNTFLKSPLIESRNIPWFVSYLNLDGFLRWNYTVWPKQPRENIIYRAWPAGDMNFVYPGNTGKPVLSLRYFCLRRGIVDFEFINMCKNISGGVQVVEKAFRKIFKFQNPEMIYDGNLTPYDLYSFNYSDYESARIEILDFLEKMKTDKHNKTN